MSFSQYLTIAARLSIAVLLLGTGITPAQAQVPGGFVEQPNTANARPALSATQVQAFLPSRGAFTFPAPYLTQGVRLTNVTDCGGSDCVWAVGYSYWRNMNNHVGSDVMYAFIGLNQSLGGGGPTLFSYNKVTEEVRNLGPLFAAGTGFASRSGEGWYFSGTQPTKMYLDDGARMLRFDVLSKQTEVVYDVRAQFGADKTLWQMHSSDDDRVHSATLVGPAGMLGCVVYHEDTAQFQYFPKIGEFDECAVDKGGRWAMSLERTGAFGNDMRIFDLATGAERIVLDPNGAVGHADMGHGYVVGADNFSNLSNAQKVWDFAGNPLLGQLVSYNNDWSAPAPNHTSHTNARPGVALDQQYACGSGATSATAVWGNEVVCFRLDGSLNVAVVAPVMTNMNAASGGDDYNKQPKGNLDVTGQYFLWTSNAGGSRVDAFIVKVPAQLLGVSATPPPPPPPPPPADLTPPVISSLASSGITTSDATITWLTSELGDSQVEYGTTLAYGSTTPLADTLLLSHSTPLSGLAPGTLYHFRVKSRDLAGNLGLSADATFTTAAAPLPPPTPPPPPPTDPAAVVWGSLVNVTATGNSLKKTGGCNGCADAGAVSNQQITGGDGYLEFTVSETNLVRYIGLTNEFAGTGSSLIRHGFRLGGGRAEVRERGKYRREVPVVTGDVLRIAVQSGVVKYSKNGVVFHTSSLAPVYPLRADTSFSSLGATLSNVRLVGIAAAPPAGPQAVTWTTLVNATVSGSTLTKSGGCDGCEDAGAVSQQQIASGDGYFEFTVSETNLVRYVGLNPNSTGTGAAEIPHAFKLVNGTAEVRELGVYKWDTGVVTGDVLRIAVQSGVVKYSKNGTVFYSSATAAGYPLRVDCALSSLNATIAGAVIGATPPEQVLSGDAPAATTPLVTSAPGGGASAGAIDPRWLALLLAAWLARFSAAPRRPWPR